MPNYKESNVSGTIYQRCHTVVASNPLGGQASVTFQEEQVVVLDGDDLHRHAGSMTKQFDGAASFPLLNPDTNEPTGKVMTHGELYQALYSLYMQAAAERDAQAEADIGANRPTSAPLPVR